ncbi:hypothetical protein [Gimesia panareensis]|uniref:hypothetical protein n=1 Tax=Gimesia panareensis TaxID=2527978 RepID=UPI00119DA7F7|nr:hypothetical protein [Gimesia panareensis]
MKSGIAGGNRRSLCGGLLVMIYDVFVPDQALSVKPTGGTQCGENVVSLRVFPVCSLARRAGTWALPLVSTLDWFPGAVPVELVMRGCVTKRDLYGYKRFYCGYKR